MTRKKINIKWTPFALGCLDEIYDYIAYKEKSEDPAFNLINAIFEKVDQLRNFPESGQPETLLKEIGQDSRYLVVASYKVIYEYHSIHNTIIITDIFHSSQNPGKIKRTTI
jgi:plasmid stabilization system protein ParE